MDAPVDAWVSFLYHAWDPLTDRCTRCGLTRMDMLRRGGITQCTNQPPDTPGASGPPAPVVPNGAPGGPPIIHATIPVPVDVEDFFVDSRPTAAAPAECPECWGTSFTKGWGAPCSRGCPARP